MTVDFTIDTSQIGAADQMLAEAMGQFEWITARAMTTAAKAAKEKVRTDIMPLIQGGPTRWTQRGLISSFARPDNLTSQVGFNYGGFVEGRVSAFTETGQARFKSGGVPSGRYMEINARGGDRNPKSHELALRRTGVIRNNQFITPGPGTKLDSHGNVSAGEYVRMLSRLRALPVGNAPIGPVSRGRSAKGRSDIDYFILREENGNPRAIAKRVGRSSTRRSGRSGRPTATGYKRGYTIAFNIVDQPNYERRFPIQSVALAEYQRVFGDAWSRGLSDAISHRARRRGM